MSLTMHFFFYYKIVNILFYCNNKLFNNPR